MNTRPPKPNRPRASDAIGQAYSRYGSELRGFFTRHSRRSQSSDDLLQEVYVELLRYSPREPVREPQAYLYKIAWHVVNRSNARSEREAIPHEPQDLERIANRALEDHAGDPSVRLEAEQRVLSALSELPPLYGATLILSRRDGLSYSQIAKELNISVHTVRKYLTRALAHVRNARKEA